MVGTRPWRQRLRDLSCYQLHRGHPQGRESPLEAQLAPWALGGPAGPRGPPPLPAAVEGWAAFVWAEPKAEGLCPTWPSSLALFSPESTWRVGLPINPSLSQAQAPRLGSALCLPFLWLQAELKRRNNLSLGNSLFPPFPPPVSLQEVLAEQSSQLYSLAGGEH